MNQKKTLPTSSQFRGFDPCRISLEIGHQVHNEVWPEFLLWISCRQGGDLAADQGSDGSEADEAQSGEPGEFVLQKFEARNPRDDSARDDCRESPQTENAIAP